MPDPVQARVCNTKPCPVDCEVGAWNAEQVLQDLRHGLPLRTREIVADLQDGGAALLTDTGFCNEAECPVDCG